MDVSRSGFLYHAAKGSVCVWRCGHVVNAAALSIMSTAFAAAMPLSQTVIGARTYSSVKSILDNRLDRRPAEKRAAEAPAIQHSNIRGPRYYN